jgi:hypothetical protein
MGLGIAGLAVARTGRTRVLEVALAASLYTACRPNPNGGVLFRWRRPVAELTLVTAVVALVSGRLSAQTVVIVAFAVLVVPVIAGLLRVTAIVYFNVFMTNDGWLRSESLWFAYWATRNWLRRTLVFGTWLGTGIPLAGFRATIALAPAALAAAASQPVLAAIALAGTYPFTGASVPWRAIALLVLMLLLARIPPRPPKRHIALPRTSRWRRNPSRCLRLRRLDRALRRSEWARAATAAQAMTAACAPDAAVEVGLREAMAQLEMAHPQEAIAALGRARESRDPTISSAAHRLAAEALTMTDQPRAALAALELASRSLDADPEHRGYIALATATALLAVGDGDAAVVQARRAADTLRRRTQMTERLRATRLTVGARLQAGDLDEAVAAAKNAVGPVLSVRWLRQYTLRGRRTGRSDADAVFSRGGPLLLELIRMNFLEAQIALDPRHATSGDDPEEVEADIEECVEIFRVLDSPLDAADAELLLARLHAAKGSAQRSLTWTLSAIVDLDRVRHSLRSQTSRARWSIRFNTALEQALDQADRCDDSPRVAELIELARVQAVPVLNLVGADGDVQLAVAPTVRVRGRAGIIRGGGSEVRPVDLEFAAASAAGDDAWWLSSWATDVELFWSLVPPTGAVSHGRIPLGPGTNLAAALNELAAALPVRQENEQDADLDLRVAAGPLLASPDAELALAVELGRMLIPPALHDELRRRRRDGRTLPLAISPAPLLGHVPWSLLAIADSQDGQPVRLVEVAEWVLAPSAALLASANERRTDQRCPLRVAVLDPTDISPAFPALPAARGLASALPEAVLVLGGSHWHDERATIERVVGAVRDAGPDASVLFGCHAVTGDRDRPSAGALVLAPDGEQPSILTAAHLFAVDIARSAFPGQVSLQACDTSDLAASAGGEWLTLAPGFLAAGAHTVVTTQFPLIDTGGDPDTDPLLQALIRGDDLRVAVRATQLAGLSRWRALRGGNGLPALDDTPLAWAPFAVCTAGRGSARRDVSSAQVPASRRLYKALGEAAKAALELRDRTVTSAHFCAAYVVDETEVFDESLIKAAVMPFIMFPLAKILRARPEEPKDAGLRPSRELVDLVVTAGQNAADNGSTLEPEHLIAEVLKGHHPGVTVLRATRLHRLPAFAGEVATNLRTAEVNPNAPGVRQPHNNPVIEEFLGRVMAARARRS